MRNYTLAEIEAMRNSLVFSYPTGQSYFAAERSAEIENRLRTYMAAGIEPDEIHKMATARQNQTS